PFGIPCAPSHLDLSWTGSRRKDLMSLSRFAAVAAILAMTACAAEDADDTDLMPDTLGTDTSAMDATGTGSARAELRDTAGTVVATARFSQDNGGVRIEIRSEEHTSELQSRENLVCRLLLEKKK